MARYHGKSGAAYGSTTAAGVAAPLISISGWTLDLSTDKSEVSAFGDPNKVYVQGLKDIKGTLTGFLDDTGLSLFTAADSVDGAKLYLYPSSAAPTMYWYGTAWLDASIAVPSSGPAAITSNFVASGAWGRKP